MPKIFYQEAIKSLLSFFKGRNGKMASNSKYYAEKCIAFKVLCVCQKKLTHSLDLNEHSENN